LTTGGAQALKSLAGTSGNTGLLSGAANAALSASQLAKLRQAYSQNVAGQQQATQQAVSQAGFTPVGTTTAFGTSNFGFDPTTGKLTSAGYTATPELAAQRQKLFGLGAEALPTTANTQDIQQQYIAQQRGLLAPGREQALANLNNTQFQTGTTGLATGGTTAGNMMQSNPELAAYYNSIANQNLGLASQAQQAGQQRAQFGASLFGTGAGLLNTQVGGQANAYAPLQTQLGLSGTVENMAQMPYNMGIQLGTAQQSGQNTGAQGMLSGALQGAQTQYQGNLQAQQMNNQFLSSLIGSAAGAYNPSAAGGGMSINGMSQLQPGGGFSAGTGGFGNFKV